MTNSPQKTVLITGCSKGSLGESLAKEFHRRNYHVIATARSRSRLTDLAQLGITTLEADMLSSGSIQALASKITTLDILFNNAGANYIMPTVDTPVAVMRRMMEINVYPHHELIQALLPLLMKSKGMIVNHTSQSAYGTKTPSSAYGASKAAMGVLTDCLRIELQPFGIRVVEVVTGMALSNMTRFEAHYDLPEGSIYTPVKQRLERSLNPKEATRYAMDGDKWARKVVGDLLDRWFGPPGQIWRGTGATTVYWFYLFDVMWKGCLNWLFRLLMGISDLKGKLEQEKKQK